jgi:hypothetical protein
MKKLMKVTGVILILEAVTLAPSVLTDVNANSSPLSAFNIRVMQYENCLL